MEKSKKNFKKLQIEKKTGLEFLLCNLKRKIGEGGQNMNKE